MISKALKPAAVACALAALAQSQIALAQQCIAQQDVSDGVIYAMPSLVQAFETKCAGELADDGFLATSDDTFLAPYRAQQQDSWPGAMRLLMQLAGTGDSAEGGDGAIGKMLEALPSDAVQPFVDAIIVQELSKEVKLQDCAKIERGIELIAPLPPENTGQLVVFILDITGVENPSLCPVPAE